MVEPDKKGGSTRQNIPQAVAVMRQSIFSPCIPDTVQNIRTVKTSFRISDAARTTLSELSAAHNHSMKDEIDLIAIDLYHPDKEFSRSLQEYISRVPVPDSAERKSQVVSQHAHRLIQAKAQELGLPRDQVVQQAILFRSAVNIFSDREYDRLVRVNQELAHLVNASNRVYTSLRNLLGQEHALVEKLEEIVHSVNSLDRLKSL